MLFASYGGLLVRFSLLTGTGITSSALIGDEPVGQICPQNSKYPSVTHMM